MDAPGRAEGGISRAIGRYPLLLPAGGRGAQFSDELTFAPGGCSSADAPVRIPRRCTAQKSH